jgi:hypothetical protein
MGAEVTARLAISAAGGDEVRVAVVGLDAPKWLPASTLMEKGLAKAGAITGLRPDPERSGAILVNPARMLASRGLPARLAPGAWEVQITDTALDLGYRESAGRV